MVDFAPLTRQTAATTDNAYHVNFLPAPTAIFLRQDVVEDMCGKK